MKILRRLASNLLVVVHVLLGLYYLLASPPLHLFYDRLPPAGDNSVYVPGAGFSGFWYHLGFFNALDVSRNKQQYYCYSSGCLSLILAAMNATVEDTHGTASGIQNDWLEGSLSRYYMVERFVKELVLDPIQNVHSATSSPASCQLNSTTDLCTSSSILTDFLPRLHILVTNMLEDGVQDRTANNLDELTQLLVQTTHIPFVTGRLQLQSLDGGFSRTLHPVCASTHSVPLTWKTAVHTLNPGIDRDSVYEYWEMGLRDAAAATVQDKQAAMNGDDDQDEQPEHDNFLQAEGYLTFLDTTA